MSFAEREPRKAVALDVQLKDFKFTEISAENSENLSTGGAFIKMENPQQPGALIKFEIKASENQTISGVARVVWQREEGDGDGGSPGVGVKFIKLDQKSRTLLETVLSNAKEIPEKAPPAEPASEPEPKLEPKPKPKSKSEPPIESERAVKRTLRPKLRTESEPKAKRKLKLRAEPEPKVERKPKLRAEQKPKAKRKFEPKKIKPATRPEDEPTVSLQDEETSWEDTMAEEKPIDLVSAPLIPSKKLPDYTPQKPEPTSYAAIERRPSNVPFLFLILGGALLAGGVLFAMRESRTATEDVKERETQAVQPTPPKEQSAAPAAEPIEKAPSQKKDEPPVAPVPEKGASAGAGAGAQSEAQAQPKESGAVEAKPETQQPGESNAAEVNPEAQPKESGAAEAEPSNEAAAGGTSPVPAVPSGGAAVLTIKSSPKGATVLINGEEKSGVTPMVIENLVQGQEIEIALKQEGFITKTETFTPEKEESTLKLSLKPARIKFRMTSTPPGARILIDGKYNGKTPFTFLRRKYKPDYHYKLTKKGYKPVEGTVSPDDWVEEVGRFYVFTFDASLEKEE
jgi:hypothetical protein